MSYGPRTRSCIEKRRKDGKSKKEAIRCLKRYIAREVFRALKEPLATKAPSWKELRPTRKMLGLTLTEAGDALGVGFQKISYAEKGRVMDVGIIAKYRSWLESKIKISA